MRPRTLSLIDMKLSGYYDGQAKTLVNITIIAMGNCRVHKHGAVHEAEATASKKSLNGQRNITQATLTYM
jgi:hypothetical protein